ncbi:MAG: hypothetical protein KF858_01340 [Candidatus Sumerlaeia bacterium]|nr:hypothetical protein [Candidatus Sumerlaeia bacterium]
MASEARRVLVVALCREEGELARLALGAARPAAEAVVASNGGELVAALAGARFAGVVVDAGAAWAGGLAALEAVRAHCPGVPAVVLGARPDACLPERAVALPKAPASFLALAGALDRAAATGSGATGESLARLLGATGMAWFEMNSDGRVLRANAAFGRLVGACERAAGGNLYEWCAEAGVLGALVRRALESSGGAMAPAFEIRSFDGTTHCVLLRLVRDESSGTLHGFAEEVGAREGELVSQRRRAEQSDHDRGELERFVHDVAHELQEPLRTVERYTRLLVERAGEALNGSSRQHADFIVQGTDRMQHLVGDLLRYSRATAADLHIEAVDLNVALARALGDLQAAIESSGAEVRRGDLPTVQGDARQLTTLFGNLVSNAIKYRGTDAPRIDISASHAGDVWTIAVQDNGIGIAAQDQERVFRPFERPGAPATVPGTGLGLALCRRIARRHGGDLWVESRPGKGSTFAFSVPSMERHHVRLHA